MTLLKFPERLEGCEQDHKTFVRYGRLSTEGEGVDIFFNKRLYSHVVLFYWYSTSKISFIFSNFESDQKLIEYS